MCSQLNTFVQVRSNKVYIFSVLLLCFLELQAFLFFPFSFTNFKPFFLFFYITVDVQKPDVQKLDLYKIRMIANPDFG